MTDIFLIGSGRSGTSFIQRIFDAHPDTFCLHEPDARLITHDPPFYPGPELFEDKAVITRDYVAKLKAQRPLRAVQKRPAFEKAYRSGGAHKMREAQISAMMVAEKTIGKVLPVSDWRVPDMTAQEPPHIVMKSVSNVGRIPLLANVLPEMKIVHIMRHPCAVAASRVRGIALGKMPRIQIFEDQLALPMAQEHGLTRERVEAMDDWERAAWQWAIVNDFAISNAAGKANVRPLLYDKLCENMLEESKAALEWCGLSFDSQVEDFLKIVLSTSEDSDRYHALVRNPQIAANKWRSSMSAGDIDKIMDIVTLSDAGRSFATWDGERQAA